MVAVRCALFCVSSVPRLQGRRRELRHSRIGGSLAVGDLVTVVVPCVQSQARASTKSMSNRLARRHNADAYCQAACIGRQVHSGFDPLLFAVPRIAQAGPHSFLSPIPCWAPAPRFCVRRGVLSIKVSLLPFRTTVNFSNEEGLYC